MPDPIRVVIADDHEVVRAGLKSLLKTQPDFVVVGEAGDGMEAVRQVRSLEPDLVIMDIRMPRMSGIEACRELRNELAVNVLFLTSYADEKAVMAAIMAGASGFMLKDGHTAQLLEAMRIAGRGGVVLDASSSAAVIDQIRRGKVVTDEDRLAQQLTEREQSILALVADGLTNRQIGAELFLSEKTVKHHVGEILSKLGLTRRVEAAAFAVRREANRLSDD